MSRRRAGISAGRSGISLAAKHMDVSEIPSSTITTTTPAARIAHPVITPTHSLWFRVVRLFITREGVMAETIGEFPRMADAITLGVRELGHARVLDSHNKVISLNGQPLERREA